MRSNRCLAIHGIAAMALLASACVRSESRHKSQAVGESLTFTSRTTDLVSGSYSLDGVTLHFATTSARITLADAGDSPVLDYHNADGMTTLTLLNGAASVIGWTDGSGNDQEVDTGDVDGQINAVMGRGDIQIAPYLSSALAAAGVDGATYPVSANLHSLAASLSQATGVDPVPPAPTASPMCTPDGSTASEVAPAGSSSEELAHFARNILRPGRAAANDGCQDLRNDPNCNNCLGMCGPGCTCWPWVCGDCCSHRGCVLHDQHCRACDRHHWRDCALCAVFDFGRPLFACN